MSRITLQFPEDQFFYSTELSVRVTDINAARHLANESMVSMISEARARFLIDLGIREESSNGNGIIVTDLVTTYHAEAYAWDRLLFEMGGMDFNRYGGDIIYRITRPADKTLVAMAKTGFVFFDYQQSKVAPMAEAFSSKFAKVNWLNR